MPIQVRYRYRRGEEETLLNQFESEQEARAAANRLWRDGYYEITILDTTPRVIASKRRD